MFEVTYITLIVTGLIWLLFKCDSKPEILVILAYYFFNVILFFSIPGKYYGAYYVIMGTLSFFVGYVIAYEFKIAAMLSHLLIPVNILGYLLWYKYYPHELYNVIAGIILIIQFFSILWRVNLNGIDRLHHKLRMDRPNTVHNKHCLVGVDIISWDPKCDTINYKLQTKTHN